MANSVFNAGFEGDVLGSEITVLNVDSGNISALRAVRYAGVEQVKLASPTSYSEAQVAGIALTSSSPGSKLSLKTRGSYKDNSWNWTVGEPIFLGTNGTLTQSEPIAQIRVIVGYAVAATSIEIKISEPIEL